MATKLGSLARGFNEAQQRGFQMLTNLMLAQKQREQELSDYDRKQKDEAEQFRSRLAQYNLYDQAEESRQLGRDKIIKGLEHDYRMKELEAQQKFSLSMQAQKGTSPDDAIKWAELDRKRSEFYIQQQFDYPLRAIKDQLVRLENPGGVGIISDESKQRIKELRFKEQELEAQKAQFMSKAFDLPEVEAPKFMRGITPDQWKQENVGLSRFPASVANRVVAGRLNRSPDTVIIEPSEAGNHYNQRVKQHRAEGSAQGRGDVQPKAKGKIVRTGTYQGRKVVEYQDGTVEYAD